MSATAHDLPRKKPKKYERVRESIRESIKRGAHRPGSCLPSERELSSQLKASKITVIRALNDLAREGVIVRRHGSGSFVSDPAQRPLIASRFLRLGVLLPDSVTPDFGYNFMHKEFLAGALKILGLDDVVPEFPKARPNEATRGRWMSEARGCLVDVLGEEPVSRLRHPPLDSVRDGGFDGILTLSIVQEGWIDELLNLGIPTVLVDYPNEKFASRADQVFFDPFPGYRAAVRAFVARGLHRIHYIGCLTHLPYATLDEQTRDPEMFSPLKGRPDADTFLRQAAWRQGMAESGLDCPKEWSHFSWHREDFVRELAEQLAGLPSHERPEAVICHAIMQAEVMLDVFRARGLPLKAAGAAGGKHRHTAWPIFADNEQLGSTAAEMLLWKLRHPSRASLRVGAPMLLPEFATPP